ncbi:MAG: hypothetical protein AAB554_00735 [Patescibacteria group bacterium]
MSSMNAKVRRFHRERRAANKRGRPWAIAGTVLLVIAIIGLIVSVACLRQDPQAASPEQSDDIVRSMRFVRHPQARDLCIGYVYVEDGGGNSRTGGPAMISVDCDKVGHMLTPPEAPATPESPR